MSGKEQSNDALFWQRFTQKDDTYRGVAQGVGDVSQYTSEAQTVPSRFLKDPKVLRSQQLARDGFPPMVDYDQSHYVRLSGAPSDVIIHAQQFLEAENCREMEASLGESADYSSPIMSDVDAGKIRGFYFEESKYVEFLLSVAQAKEQLFLEGRRLDGCAFTFTKVWNSMVQSLGEDGLVDHEGEEGDDMEMADYLNDLFDSDSEDMDIEEMCQLQLAGSPEIVETMIDELGDVNYQETYASKLAFNCRNEQNKEAIMQHSQKLFDTIIESIMCNITFAYFISSQLPLYRSLAVLLNTIFETQLDNLEISTEQYEVLVAATKKWGLEQSEDGAITTSEQIAGILSKQLVRCAPGAISEKAMEDLNILQSKSPYECVQMNISDALMAC